MEYLPWIWVAVLAGSLVLEAATVSLVAIWFSLGALVALLFSLFAGETVQIAVFLIVSVVSLILTRPLAAKFLQGRKVSTNADRVIGMRAVVTEEINNATGKGLVRVENAVWSARSVDNTVIPEHSFVQVQAIEGVKLMVLPLDEKLPEA